MWFSEEFTKQQQQQQEQQQEQQHVAKVEKGSCWVFVSAAFPYTYRKWDPLGQLVLK